jgi:hypothetical protein
MPSIYNPCAVFALLRHVTVPAYLFHAPSVLLRLCSSTWCQCYSTSGSLTSTCGLIFYIYSFPTQALMAEMCAWQPFTHQTEIYNPSTTSWTLTSDWACSLRLHLHFSRKFSMQWMNTHASPLPTNIFSGLHSLNYVSFRTFSEHYSNRTITVSNEHPCLGIPMPWCPLVAQFSTSTVFLSASHQLFSQQLYSIILLQITLFLAHYGEQKIQWFLPS